MLYYVVKTYNLMDGMQVVHVVDDNNEEFTGATWDHVRAGEYYRVEDISLQQTKPYDRDAWERGPWAVIKR